jgi:hypothetical protein
MTDYKVTKGQPTDEELAALVAVIKLRMRDQESPEQLAPAWNDVRLALRPVTAVGADAWRRSSLPN